MRLFFYCPTTEKPSGGQKQTRFMGQVLSELGAQAFLLRDRRYFAREAGFDNKMLPGVAISAAPFPFEDAGRYLQPEDIVMLPEGIDGVPPLWRSWKCRVGLINQNGFFALRNWSRTDASRTPFEFAITVAPYVASVCKEFLGIPSERIFEIPVWIVRPPFELIDAVVGRAPSICCMPRKLPAVTRRVRELVSQSHPDVAWVDIDGMPEVEVARILRQHSIFFAAHDLEACPTSGLEAMACGCLVAGFGGTGRFPHPYATPANGLWVPDRNVEAAAAAVQSAIEVVRTGGERYSKYLDAARQTVLRFTKEEMHRGLREMLEVVAVGNYAERRTVVPALGWRGRAYGYWLLYNDDRLGWPGRFLSSVSSLLRPARRVVSRACSYLILGLCRFIP